MSAAIPEPLTEAQRAEAALILARRHKCLERTGPGGGPCRTDRERVALLEPWVGRLVAEATAAERLRLTAPAAGADEITRLRASVARVEAVHADAGDGWCLGCDADWPCATWDALRGES